MWRLLFTSSIELRCALDDKTPYEAWHVTVPTVHYLWTFGCIAHVKITCPGLKKVDDSSTKEIFVGDKPGSKAYWCYDPIDECIIISRDVIFDEGTQWCWDSTDGEPAIDAEPFTVEYTTKVVHDLASPLPSPAPILPSPPEVPPERGPVPVAEVNEEQLNADHDNAPLHLCDLTEVIWHAPVPRLAQRVLDVELNFTLVEEPASFREAEKDVAWHATMQDEIKAIEENNTWELTTLPTCHRAIGLKWVYKVKRNEADEVQ
jgi:hypothetical protein